MARSTPKPPSEIQVVIRFLSRRGSVGYDITTEAPTDDHGKRSTLPSAPECRFAVNPFPERGITVTVRPLPTDPPA